MVSGTNLGGRQQILSGVDNIYYLLLILSVFYRSFIWQLKPPPWRLSSVFVSGHVTIFVSVRFRSRDTMQPFSIKNQPLFFVRQFDRFSQFWFEIKEATHWYPVNEWVSLREDSRDPHWLPGLLNVKSFFCYPVRRRFTIEKEPANIHGNKEAPNKQINRCQSIIAVEEPRVVWIKHAGIHQTDYKSSLLALEY